jgi:RecA-family ATPase/DNA-binding transcriptional ArsR family regulator
MDAYPPISLKELMDTDYPEQTWLIDKLIPASAITILSAEPGSYKTYMLLETAVKVATGEPLFSEFATQKVGTLLLDEENGLPLLQQRLKELKAPKDLPIYFYSYEGFTLDEEYVDRIILECKTHDIKLLMIDSLVRVHGADENTAQDMAAVFKQLRRFAGQGITVLITHHNRKPGANKGGSRHEMRGSSDILAAVDCHIALRRDGDFVTVEQTKQRYAKELSAFDVQVVDESEDFVFKYLGSNQDTKDRILREAITELLEEHGELLQKELRDKLKKSGNDVNPRTLSKALKAMNGDGIVTQGKGKGNSKPYSLAPLSEPQP